MASIARAAAAIPAGRRSSRRLPIQHRCDRSRARRKDFAVYFVMLDIAQDSLMASAYQIALIVALEEFFGRVKIFGNELTLARYCQKEWPSGAQIRLWRNHAKIRADVAQAGVDAVKVC
jgi:hypothetical protein